MDSIHDIAGPTFPIRQSVMDDAIVNYYSQRILCFALPPSVDASVVSATLRSGLEQTVKDIPILAGIVSPQEDIEGQQHCRRVIRPGGTVQFKCKNLGPSIDFANLRMRCFPQSEFDADVLCPVPGHAPLDATLPVMAAQANFVQGGLLLVVCIIHTATDGTGITTVLKTWSESCRKLQHASSADAKNGEMAAPVICFDERYPAPGERGRIADHFPYVYRPNDCTINPILWKILATPTASDVFHFSADSLSSLLLAASPSGIESSSSSLKITTHDAMSALIWRSVMIARQRTDRLKEDFVQLAIPVDFRSRIDPPLPLDFVGNAIYNTAATHSLDGLHAGNSLASMAQAVRKAVLSVNNDRLRDYIAMRSWVSDVRFIHNEGIEYILDRLIWITSHYRFPLHSFSWGPALGTYEIMRLPKQGILNGFVTVFPRLPDGGCEVKIPLEPEVLDALKGDEMWCRYATIR